MVRPASHGGCTCPVVLRKSTSRSDPFAYRTITLYGGPFQVTSARAVLCNCLTELTGRSGSSTTPTRLRTVIHLAWVGLGCSPFVRHYLGNDLFSSGYLDVSVPPLASSSEVPLMWWVAPLGYPRMVTDAQLLSAAYRSYATPFIGSRRQGIHRAPLVACPHLPLWQDLKQWYSVVKVQNAPLWAP